MDRRDWASANSGLNLTNLSLQGEDAPAMEAAERQEFAASTGPYSLQEERKEHSPHTPSKRRRRQFACKKTIKDA
ncbi:hypothetical protein E2C01_036503 [Portunus trituberculatus]|uniref:Uncharacterized protein n=1 Tax=Portunus trituberculatus TaxID=210409 RepID=A0A5B7F8W4_PORTR|nr:hypothetical protein [Portunus trituberculatus]